MSFIKSFGISILVFIGLNFLFYVIAYAVDGELETFFDLLSDEPLLIGYVLFGAIALLPGLVLQMGIIYPLYGEDYGLPDLTIIEIILFIGLIISPLIAAILSGRFGESKFESFGGWFLTAIISLALVAIFIFIDEVFVVKVAENSRKAGLPLIFGSFFLSPPAPPWPDYVISTLTISVIVCGLISAVFYGFFALLVTKIEYY
ncbi:MAG: hypothetical protein ACFE9T_07495 [Promethearchaeota archaeon]